MLKDFLKSLEMILNLLRKAVQIQISTENICECVLTQTH